MKFSLMQFFLAGLAWCWAEQRDVLLIAGALALGAFVLGVWSGNPFFVVGGVALLLAMAFACIVYGSHGP